MSEITEIKTLNGYPLADTKAREDIATLSEEKAFLYDVLDVDGIASDVPNLINMEALSSKFERTNGDAPAAGNTCEWDAASKTVYIKPLWGQSGGHFFAGQKIPVAEGEVYTLAAKVKFTEATTTYRAVIGFENQYAKNGQIVEGYVPGTWQQIQYTLTVDADTASKSPARVIIMSTHNGDGLYIKDVVVVKGSSLPEINTNNDSARIVSIEKRLDKVENGAETPAFELEAPAREFSALFNSTGNVESFLFFTDPHLVHYNGWETDFPVYTNFIGKMYDATPTSFCVCGGDWLGNSDTMAAACYKLGLIDGRMRGLIHDYCPIVGNHDTNYQGKLDASAANGTGTLTNETIRNLWFRREGAAYYRYQGAASAMYVLDSGLDSDTTMNAYRWQQIDWLAESLKTEKDENVFFALHIIYRYGVSDSAPMALAENAFLLAEAYNARGSITLNGKAYNFAGCTGKVRFVIGGHTHEDATGTVHGIPFAITTQTQQTAGPTFDLVLADYDAGTLHLVRVGEGESRTVTMA